MFNRITGRTRAVRVARADRAGVSVRCVSGYAAAASAVSNLSKPRGARTGIVMLNMGGPPDAAGVNPFLRALFTDPEIIPLGKYQNTIGRFVARRRTPKITEQYTAIGGGSPIAHWTHTQGAAMIQKLEAMCGGGPNAHARIGSPVPPEATANIGNDWFNYYIAFRYAPPLTEQTLLQMKADGVERAVAFSQYPQWSCTTAGSSINHLWSEVRRLGLTNQFKWSVIDRWYNHPTYIRAMVERIRRAMAEAIAASAKSGSGSPPLTASDFVIVFSAHSLPMKVVYKGDPYVPEIYASAEHVSRELHRQLNDETKAAAEANGAGAGAAQSSAASALPPYVVSWQSKVGYLPWMGPSTADTIKQFATNPLLLPAPIAAPGSTAAAASAAAPASAPAAGRRARAMLVVPIAFTSDHIETLYEIDIEYRHMFEQFKSKSASNAAVDLHFVRAGALNDSDLLTTAQAQIVYEHLNHTRSLPNSAARYPTAADVPAHSYTHEHAPTYHYSSQYPLRCIACENPACRSVVNPII